ncbi:MAG TPA: SH3 domain-containing protein [Planococcus sp. (in: firmicutes)]|nr:SH3 domain-containing protein [Planococcus sp. (in: firmicutes)]
MGRKWLIAFILFILFLSGSVPLVDGNHAAAESLGAEISATSANVRSGPGLSYSVIDSLKKGQKVTILSQSDDWYEIDSGGKKGWIASWLTVSASTEGSGTTAVSTVDRLNIRSQPERSSAVLGQMNAGEQVEVLRDHGEWVEINYRNIRGFASKQYISISSAPQTAVQPESNSNSFEIGVSKLNVRSEPDLSSSILNSVRQGEVYAVKSLSGNWVQIQLNENETGWVYAFHGTLSNQLPKQAVDEASGTANVLTNGTNLRAEPSTSSDVVSRANAGDQLTITGKQDDWLQVSLPEGKQAFVASWVVSTGEAAASQPASAQPARKKGTLSGVTIVLDPGHGGNDGGTVGARNSLEKELTLSTAELLSHHLRSAGAEVTLTRESDVYVDLRRRVAVSHQAGADAFISIHYDANEDASVQGFTSYYTNSYQEQLAQSINQGLAGKLALRDRGVQQGNYLVLRENQHPAVLVELGFLSNYNEERIVTTEQFRNQAALGLYTGIINYFDSELE